MVWLDKTKLALNETKVDSKSKLKTLFHFQYLFFLAEIQIK